MSKTNVKVELIGNDGNAFAIMGAVSKALKRNGHAELAKTYMTEAMAGDYNNLLTVTDQYVEII